MTLVNELERARELASAHIGDGDAVSGLLATEAEPGRRVYVGSIDGADGNCEIDGMTAHRPMTLLARQIENQNFCLASVLQL